MLERFAIGIFLGTTHRGAGVIRGVSVLFATTVISLLAGELATNGASRASERFGPIWDDIAPLISAVLFAFLAIGALMKSSHGAIFLNLAGGIASALAGVRLREHGNDIVLGTYGLTGVGYVLGRAASRLGKPDLSAFAVLAFTSLGAVQLEDIFGPVTCFLLVFYAQAYIFWPVSKEPDDDSDDEELHAKQVDEAPQEQEDELLNDAEEPNTSLAAPTRTFVCPACWVQFTSDQELLQHDKVFHSEPRGFPIDEEETLLAFSAFFR